MGIIKGLIVIWFVATAAQRVPGVKSLWSRDKTLEWNYLSRRITSDLEDPIDFRQSFCRHPHRVFRHRRSMDRPSRAAAME